MKHTISFKSQNKHTASHSWCGSRTILSYIYVALLSVTNIETALSILIQHSIIILNFNYIFRRGNAVFLNYSDITATHHYEWCVVLHRIIKVTNRFVRFTFSLLLFSFVYMRVNGYIPPRPVILSISLTGPGPTTTTVLDPAAIWVRPASHTTYDSNLSSRAASRIPFNVSSFWHFNAILADPVDWNFLHNLGAEYSPFINTPTAAWQH